MTGEINYCERCGVRLVRKSVDGTLRPSCPGCGHVVFLDPKLAAVVVVSVDGKLVLIKRGIEPGMGRWSFPSGYVDRGESVEDGAVREVKEETGLDVRITQFVGLYSRRGSPVVLAAYSAEVVGGSLAPGSDAQEAALYSPDELPPLAFPSSNQILADWRKLGA